MPEPIPTKGFPSHAAADRYASLRRKAKARALQRLKALHPVQFEQLVIAELASLRVEQSKEAGRG